MPFPAKPCWAWTGRRRHTSTFNGTVTVLRPGCFRRRRRARSGREASRSTLRGSSLGLDRCVVILVDARYSHVGSLGAVSLCATLSKIKSAETVGVAVDIARVSVEFTGRRATRFRYGIARRHVAQRRVHLRTQHVEPWDVSSWKHFTIGNMQHG